MARLARNANSDVVVQTLWFCPPHMPVKTFLLAVRSAATPAHAAAASARQCRLAWSCYAQVAAGTRPCTAPSRAAHAAGQCPRQGLLCAGHRSCLSALARRPNQATCTGDARTHARTEDSRVHRAAWARAQRCPPTPMVARWRPTICGPACGCCTQRQAQARRQTVKCAQGQRTAHLSSAYHRSRACVMLMKIAMSFHAMS